MASPSSVFSSVFISDCSAHLLPLLVSRTSPSFLSILSLLSFLSFPCVPQVSSKADDEHSLSVLRQPVPSIHNPPAHLITALRKGTENCRERFTGDEFPPHAWLPRRACASVHCDEASDVLEEEGARSLGPEEADEFEEQMSWGRGGGGGGNGGGRKGGDIRSWEHGAIL